MTEELLEPIGVFFPSEKIDGKKVIDFTSPVVPSCWDFDEMILKLKRRAELLKSLPSGVDLVGRNLVGRGSYVSPVSQCRTCRFFDAQCCALEHHVDWGEEGIELGMDVPMACEDFVKLPARLLR